LMKGLVLYDNEKRSLHYFRFLTAVSVKIRRKNN